MKRIKLPDGWKWAVKWDQRGPFIPMSLENYKKVQKALREPDCPPLWKQLFSLDPDFIYEERESPCADWCLSRVKGPCNCKK